MFDQALNWLETALGWCLNCFLNGCGIMLLACAIVIGLAIILAVVYAVQRKDGSDQVLFACHCTMYTVGLVGGLMVWIGGFGMMFGGFAWIPLKILTFLF